jgi:hypothetical protein
MPSKETLWFVPLVVIGLLVGMSLTIFLTPVIGVPLLLIALIFGIVMRGQRQATSTGRMQDFRETAPSEGVEFTERDRETLNS